MRKLTFYHIFHELFVQEGFLWVRRRQFVLLSFDVFGVSMFCGRLL